jgi:hypothetical protein
VIVHEMGMAGSSDRNIAVNGPADIGAVATNPATLDFGSTCAGVTSAPQLVDVYASDAGGFSVTSVSALTNGFQVMLPSNLQVRGNHGNDVMMMVTANPAGPGAVTSNATVHTDIPVDPMNTPTADFVLRANGLPAGITVDQDKLHFGAVVKDMLSPMKQVTFANCNASALTGIDATIVGPDMNDFAIVGPPSIPSTLQPGQSITFQIQMTPRKINVIEMSTLMIAYSGGMTPVALDGTGVTDLGGNKDRQTYYACSTGRPIGLAPLALALALALRRRRRR